MTWQAADCRLQLVVVVVDVVDVMSGVVDVVVGVLCHRCCGGCRRGVVGEKHERRRGNGYHVAGICEGPSGPGGLVTGF